MNWTTLDHQPEKRNDMNPDNQPTIRVENPANVISYENEGILDLNPKACIYLLPVDMTVTDICKHLETLGCGRIDNLQDHNGQPIYPDGTPS